MIETKRSILKLIKEAEEQFTGTGKALLDIEDYVAEHLTTTPFAVPPVFVGQMVYAFCDDFGVVLPYFVENLNIGFMDKNRNYWTYEANCHAEETDELLDEIDFDLDDIGKTVFLTREEAEKALERSRG